MEYLYGALLSLVSKTVISVANVLDGQLSRRSFSSIWALASLNDLLLLPALPVLYIVLDPGSLPLNSVWIIAIIAAIEFFYQIPYYKAFREAQTSVVVSMFNFQKILVPIFAYFVVGERLTVQQYAGFGLIVVCSILLAFDRKTFRISKALWYMIPVTIVLAFESVLMKYALNQVEWNTFYFWSVAFTTVFAIPPLLYSNVRNEVIPFLKKPFTRNYVTLWLQSISTWVAGIFGTLALSMLPVTINKAIGSFHSLLVHFISAKYSKRLQVDDGEHISANRILLLIVIGIGVFLTLVTK